MPRGTAFGLKYSVDSTTRRARRTSGTRCVVALALPADEERDDPHRESHEDEPDHHNQHGRTTFSSGARAASQV